jgi:hypothetical protein
MLRAVRVQGRGLAWQPPLGAVPVALHACQTNKGTALILQIHHALYDAVSLHPRANEHAGMLRAVRVQGRGLAWQPPLDCSV